MRIVERGKCLWLTPVVEGENESAYGKHDGVQEAAEKRKAEWRFQHVGAGY